MHVVHLLPRLHAARLEGGPNRPLTVSKRLANECEVAAEVATALDRVVLTGRDVLVVTGGDDQVVRTSQFARAGRLDIGLGEDIDVSSRPRQPLEERQVV